MTKTALLTLSLLTAQTSLARADVADVERATLLAQEGAATTLAVPEPPPAAPETPPLAPEAPPAEASADPAAPTPIDPLLFAAEAPAAAESEMVRFYGFMDFGLARNFAMAKDARLTPFVAFPKSSFVLGNLNLYTLLKPVENWEGLIEVRYSLQPHGQDEQLGNPVAGTQYRRTNTIVRDWYSPGGGSYTVQWGGIILERAHMDWNATNWLTLRVGQWFTPYGIWNVDHGTPTLIALILPQLVVFQLFPARQTGVQAFGSFREGAVEYGYNAYVSNGRTVTPVDLTDDKMVGGRIFARSSKPFNWAVGVSGLYGRNTDEAKNIKSFEPFVVSRDTIVDYREAGVAADVSVDVGSLKLRSEFALRDIVYKDGKRELVEGTPFKRPDHTELGGYVLAAYQLPFWGLQPYAMIDYLKRPDELGLGEQLIAPSLGLNDHFNHAIQLKLQVARPSWFEDEIGDSYDNDSFYVFQSRLVMAF